MKPGDFRENFTIWQGVLVNCNVSGSTPLHWAARYGHAPIVRQVEVMCGVGACCSVPTQPMSLTRSMIVALTLHLC